MSRLIKFRYLYISKCLSPSLTSFSKHLRVQFVPSSRRSPLLEKRKSIHNASFHLQIGHSEVYENSCSLQFSVCSLWRSAAGGQGHS